MSPDRTDAWRPRVQDFPPDGALEREPRLGFLEDNVVFRSMVFGLRTRRSMPRFESGFGLLLMILASITLLACFGPLFFFIAMPLRQYFQRPEANVVAFFGIPEVLLRELIDLRVEPDLWTLALWGRAASRRSRRWATVYVCITLAGVALYAFFWLPEDPSRIGAAMHAVVSLALGFVVGFTIGGNWGAPHALLPALSIRVQRIRRATSLSNNPLSWLYILALFSGLALLIFILSGIATAFAILVYRIFPDPMEVLHTRKWFIPLAILFLPLLFGFLTGGLVVLLRARRACGRVDEYVERMGEDVDAMLVILKQRFDYGGEQKIVVPQPRFRPSGESPGRSGGRDMRWGEGSEIHYELRASFGTRAEEGEIPSAGGAPHAQPEPPGRSPSAVPGGKSDEEA